VSRDCHDILEVTRTSSKFSRIALFHLFSYSLLDEVHKFHEHGTHVPQLESRVDELKKYIKRIMDEDEVDPRNEWAIKAHQLLV
jgi:hypothetical protein